MQKRRKRALLYLLISALVAVYLLPILYMVLLSLKKVGSGMGSAFFNSGLTLENYADVFTSGLYTNYILNGLTVSLSAALIAVVIGFFSAYGVSRFRFPLREQMFMGIIAIKAMPPVLMCIAFFQIVVKIHLYDTLSILVILDAIFNVPLAVLMLRNFMDAIPRELDEAAQIDGCRQLRYLCKVVLPLSSAGLAAIFVQCFLLSWNEYMFAVVFIASEENKMPTVAIFDFIGQWSTNYIGIVTFAVLLSLPVIVAFVALQKYFVKGMLAGAEK